MQVRASFGRATAPDGADAVAGRDTLSDRAIGHRQQMRVPRDDAATMIDPYLPAADTVERRAGGISELHRFEERDALTFGVPVDEVAVDPHDHAVRDGADGGAAWRRELDALVPSSPALAPRVRQEQRNGRKGDGIYRQT